jgi:hypothetical protein
LIFSGAALAAKERYMAVKNSILKFANSADAVINSGVGV